MASGEVPITTVLVWVPGVTPTVPGARTVMFENGPSHGKLVLVTVWTNVGL